MLEKTPAEQVQELLARGYISDLLKANVGQMNRDDFRRLCDLSPLSPLVLPAFHLISTFDRDMRKQGWELDKDTEDKEGEFTPELVNIFKGKEQRISGEELLYRAGVCYGQRHAEAMLRDQRKIPEEYQQHYLPFPGTVWVNSGDRYVPCLYWRVDRWCLNFCWLEVDFNRDVRLVRSRK